MNNNPAALNFKLNSTTIQLQWHVLDFVHKLALVTRRIGMEQGTVANVNFSSEQRIFRVCVAILD
ncbi:MAG TPA: hypothetical protein VH415_03920 [Nitrososphaeraceae archaeon]